MNVRMLISLFVLFIFLAAAMSMGSNILAFVDLNSIVIVAGVAFAGTFWAFSFSEIFRVFLETFTAEGLEAERGEMGHAVFTRMKESFVAGGLTGTLLGLVSMLQNLEDPTAIGPAMAVALLTMLYGVVFGEVICGAAAGDCLTRAGLTTSGRGRRGSATLNFTIPGLLFSLLGFFVLLLSMGAYM